MFRVDPQLQRVLGETALSEIVRLVEPDGDCTVCHRTLRAGPLTLSARGTPGGRPEDLLVVLPAHAACAPSTWQRASGAFSPARSYRTLALLLAAEAGAIPAVLINDSIDVQVGQLFNDRWHDSLGRSAALRAVEPLAASPVPTSRPTWGATLTGPPDAALLTLTGPIDRVECTVNSTFTDLIRRGGGMVLVLVSADARIAEVTARGVLDPLFAAASRGGVYGAWAHVGGFPTTVPLPEPDVSIRPPHPAARQMTISSDLTQVAGDLRAQAYAAFSDAPALGLRAVAGPDGRTARMPVLLVEPLLAALATDAYGGRRELRVESVIASGLARLATAAPRSVARAWQAHRDGPDVVLTEPSGQPIARAPAPDYPPGWLEAATEAGHVLVVYGPKIGVRTPPGAQSWRDADRRGELADATRTGMAAWGLVRWT